MAQDNDSNWFANWFDHPLYHILYRHRNQEEATSFVNKLADHLNISPGLRVLDLACGKGRHAVIFHRLGYAVLGVDLSPRSIVAASENTQPGLDFLVHDMRFPLPGMSFHAIFNLFTSFGYFLDDSDNDRVLQSIGRNLHPEGIFVMDYLNADKTIANLVHEEQVRVEGHVFQITRHLSDQGFIVKRIVTEWQGRPHHFEERVRAFTLKDLEELFRKNKLRIREVFGDYQLNDFDRASSDRLILIAHHQ